MKLRKCLFVIECAIVVVCGFMVKKLYDMQKDIEADDNDDNTTSNEEVDMTSKIFDENDTFVLNGTEYMVLNSDINPACFMCMNEDGDECKSSGILLYCINTADEFASPLVINQEDLMKALQQEQTSKTRVDAGNTNNVRTFDPGIDNTNKASYICYDSSRDVAITTNNVL